MATVTFDGTRVNGAGDGNTTTGFTSWGATVTAEPDYFYTNSYCISVLVKTAEVGMYCTGGTTVDFSSPARVWLAKVIQTNYTAIDGNGLQLYLGNDDTNHWRYEIYSATTYPAAGGFQIVPIDPNVSGYITQTVGTPSITTIDFYGIKSDANAQAKAPNLGIDAIDYITSGTGLTLTGTSGTFSDFVTFDETTITNRYGIVTTREGILYIVGVLTIGSPVTSASFSDSDRTIVFPDGRFNAGFCGIDLDISNASTSITFSAITMIGRGTSSGSADTRPDFTISGTSGSASIDASTFTSFRAITLTSTASLADSTFNSCSSLIQSSATIDNCTFNTPPISSSSAFLTCNNPSAVTNCTFISSGTGHAMELTSATAGNSYTLTNHTYSGYASTNGTTGNEVIYNNSGGAVTLNISGGDTPTIRNGTGSTTTVVSNTVTTTVTVQDLSNGSVIQGANVLVWVTGSPPANYFYQASVSITGSGTTATVTHSSHGLSTGDHVIIEGVTNDDDYNGAFQVTVTDANTYTYTTSETLGSSPATGTPTATFALINDSTDINGEVSDTRSLPGGNQTIAGWVRKSSASPYYVQGSISGTVNSTSGLSTTIQLARDE